MCLLTFMGAGMDDGRKPGRGVLEGAFALLEELARGGESGLTQLAEAAGLPKATAHRLLDQLTALGAVQRGCGRYQVGPEMARLGQAWQPDRALRAAAHYPLRQLATATRATVGVAAPDAGRMLIVGGMIGEVDEVFPLRAGTVLPAGSTADMVLATDKPEMELPAERYSAREWARLVTGVRDRGVAFDYEVQVAPVACLAAPVHAPSGKIVAAIGAVVLDSKRLASMAEDIRRAANLVSANLARPRR